MRDCGLTQKLAKRRDFGNLRTLRRVDGLIDFASNDYLGMAHSKLLEQNVLKELHELKGKVPLNGYGSTGSRLLTGNSAYAEELEKRLADFHGYEACLLYSCGYMANLGLISSIAGADDILFYDTQVHASTHDGIRLSRVKSVPFRHHDVEHLKRRLQKAACSGRRFVCIESVYSVDGSVAPLEEICQICEEHGADLIVDEAHALGIFDSLGCGLISEKKLNHKVFAQITTFGKALGSHGAIVLGKKILKEYLINFSRPCLYTTALPLHNLAAIKCAYDLLPTLHEEREKLFEVIRFFLKFHPSGSMTPIQQIKCKSPAEALSFSRYLATRGYDVRAIMSPTVRRGEECLRLCLHAYNTQSQIQDLIQLIKSKII